ncbi:hypothetical protein UPYG_G00007580 [Umbra pygmaea]|uniref:TNFR-Cys domain-containing protein n=1 Tax=Umbra pygmaea TaxID=75934 RepID=A0ABD0XHT6_UMBPY
MAVDLVLRVLYVSLLTVGCLSFIGPDEIKRGCNSWITSSHSSDVCCNECHPGNRLVKQCGPDPEQLCEPCENNRYITDPIARFCTLCTQCVGGAQKLKTPCTKSKDTECDCKAGLRCGDDKCKFCVDECGKGQEPIPEKRSCRDCPNGTFNDQIHEKCKPWRKSCPHPGESIVALGNAVSDSKCSMINDVSEVRTLPTNRWDFADYIIMLVISSSSCLAFIILIICILVKIKNKPEKTTPNKRTITVKPCLEPTPPTDDPRSLMEVSFHQPQQEQGSSSESLYSQESETKLLHV